MSFPFLLIGHRGSGKSVLGELLAARLGAPFTDVDAEIQRVTGTSAAEWVETDEPRFRTMESETVRETVARGGVRVIAAGAGLRDIPTGAFVLFIDRDGWEETARRSRVRLRPGMPFEEEVRWMKANREPLYAAASHARARIPLGMSVEDAAELVGRIADLALASAGSPAFRRTWLVVPSAATLERCAGDVRLFGLAGLEIRSDRFSKVPDTDAPILASLRDANAGFLASAGRAAAIDCDVASAAAADLSHLEPRTLVVSSHPKDVDQEYFDAMVAAGHAVTARFPEWKEHLVFKFAPLVKSWVELRFAYELCRVFRKRGGKVSFLPQGRRWDWMRAFLLWNGNDLNYVSPGTAQASFAPPPLEYFLPHAAGPAPRAVCGVIGDPVDGSAGDIVHRHWSIREDGGACAYVKIPVPADELEHALYFLMKLGFHGLSVTSPYKAAVIHSNFVTSPEGLPSGNTLTFRDGGWSLSDTDRLGMEAALEEFERRGVSPGPTAVFGCGGVAPAVVDALERRGWVPVRQTSAREGWGDLRGMTFTLIVNAGRESTHVYDRPPSAHAWLDLAYHGIERIPEGIEHYQNGWRFFLAQAYAQRKVWGFDTRETDEECKT
ncbi:MAG: shikimate kinase [Bacteroidota bacterium]|nr:shikimate kinase [Bacteroidota bacterium]